MYQKLTIIGNLGNDPDARYTDGSGDSMVCNFNIATNRVYYKDNKKEKDTVWFGVSAWGKLAEICNEHLSKGDLVQVEGIMRPPNIWNTDEGEPRCNLEMKADKVLFLKLSGNNDSGGNQVSPDDDDFI